MMTLNSTGAKLSDILPKGLIFPAIKATNKLEAIDELATLLVSAGKVTGKEELTKALLDRERLGSTGIGDNIAIPHAKLKNATGVIVLYGRSVKGIDFDSLDQKPVHHIFLLIAPENSAGLHLKVLARISRLLKSDSFRTRLLGASSQNDIYHIIESEDMRYA